MHLIVRLLPLCLGLFSAITLTGSVHAQLAVVPTDVQQPGTQPGEVPALQPASDCFSCHANYDQAVEPGRNWEGSMMAHASRDPLFWAATAVAEQDFPGSADLCLRCHVPRGWADGRSTPTDGSALLDADADGVSCDVCHRLTNPDESEWYGTQYAPFVANDGGSPATGWYGGGMYALWGDLASTGSDLLDAWLATGMAAPHVMASTTWTAGTSVSPWTDLGNSLAGAGGAPVLSGSGPAISGQSLAISLENAAPNSSAWLVMGASRASTCRPRAACSYRPSMCCSPAFRSTLQARCPSSSRGPACRPACRS
jgi:hypothetical protein